MDRHRRGHERGKSADAVGKGLRLWLVEPHHSRAACPEWYPLIRAARYLGVPPWDLAKQPAAWMHWALLAEQAEAAAEEAAVKRHRPASSHSTNAGGVQVTRTERIP